VNLSVAMSHDKSVHGHHGKKGVPDADSKSYVSAAAASARAPPKKGGAVGNYVWGKPGVDDLKFSSRALDKDDPNYDSDDEAKLVSSGALQNPHEEFKVSVQTIVKEFFSSEDEMDALKSAQEIGQFDWNYEFVKQAISMSLELSNRERALCSQLISCMCGTVVDLDQIEYAFAILLDRCDDLALDTPEASDLLGTMLARCIVDDCMAPSFLDRCPIPTSQAQNAVAKAKSLLADADNHGHKRLETIWGASAVHHVKTLKKSFTSILKEFIVSLDYKEVEQALRELKVADFYFHFVKIAVVTAIENVEKLQQISKLLSFLQKEGLISDQSMKIGLQSAADSLPDIVVDVSPQAREFYFNFLKAGEADGYVSPAFISKVDASTKLAAEKNRDILNKQRDQLLQQTRGKKSPQTVKRSPQTAKKSPQTAKKSPQTAKKN